MQIETTRRTDPTPSAVMALAIVLLMPTAASAQSQRTIYGSDGKVQSRVTTDSQGSATIFDAGGKVQGRTATDSQGTTVIYGSDGKVIGRTHIGNDGTTIFYDATGRNTGTVTTTPKPQQRK